MDSAPEILIGATDHFTDDLYQEWEQLYASDQSASLVLSPYWIAAWEKHLRDPSIETLLLATFRKQNKLIGLLPLCVRKNILGTYIRTCGHSFSPVHSCFPEMNRILGIAANDTGDMVRKFFSIHVHNWFMLEYYEAGVLPKFVHAWQFNNKYPAYYADLSEGFENYLGRLGRSTKELSRRLLRQVDKGQVSFSLFNDQENLNKHFTTLVALHEKRWQTGGRRHGAFGTENKIAFHRNLFASAAAKRNEIVLAVLTVGDLPVASIYGWFRGGRFEMFQSGIDISQKVLKSPGITAHLLLMRSLSLTGCDQYHFLAGSERYKEDLSTDAITLESTTVVPKKLQPCFCYLANRIVNKLCARTSEL